MGVWIAPPNKLLSQTFIKLLCGIKIYSLVLVEFGKSQKNGLVCFVGPVLKFHNVVGKPNSHLNKFGT